MQQLQPLLQLKHNPLLQLTQQIQRNLLPKSRNAVETNGAWRTPRTKLVRIMDFLADNDL
jgi:hypothetical protein